MRADEILEQNPNATKVVKDWLLNYMMESFNDENVPEDFKESMIASDVINTQLEKVIELQPRTLFDVFDSNGIYISIYTREQANKEILFTCAINTIDEQHHFNSRLLAETTILERAFRLLEEKLISNIEVIE